MADKKMGYQIAEGFVHRKSADKDVLISVGNNVANFNGYILLNATAAFLWDYMTQPRSLEELTEYMLENFEVTRQQAHEDICAMINDFLSHGMLREVSCEEA